MRNVGRFESVATAANIPLGRLTLIYAENGRGKTTLAAILRSLATGDPIPIVERRRLAAQHPPHVVIACAGAQKTLALSAEGLYWRRMIFRRVACALLLVAFTACDSLHSPYKKKDEEVKKPMRDQSSDQSFMAFVGRLRTAVSKHDTAMMASLMTPDFGYRWDEGPPGETAFTYWDQHNLWGELSNTLQQGFGPSDMYMVGPPQAITDPKYAGYRVGMRTIRGSWRFAYFVPAEGPR